jgi:hypothetical protein
MVVRKKLAHGEAKEAEAKARWSLFQAQQRRKDLSAQKIERGSFERRPLRENDSLQKQR